jgi:hypothetical protein
MKFVIESKTCSIPVEIPEVTEEALIPFLHSAVFYRLTIRMIANRNENYFRTSVGVNESPVKFAEKAYDSVKQEFALVLLYCIHRLKKREFDEMAEAIQEGSGSYLEMKQIVDAVLASNELSASTSASSLLEHLQALFFLFNSKGGTKKDFMNYIRSKWKKSK